MMSRAKVYLWKSRDAGKKQCSLRELEAPKLAICSKVSPPLVPRAESLAGLVGNVDHRRGRERAGLSPRVPGVWHSVFSKLFAHGRISKRLGKACS